MNFNNAFSQRPYDQLP
jgi:hypothetical protein